MKSLLTKILVILALLTGLTFAYNRHIDNVRSEVAVQIAEQYNRSLISLQNKVDSKSEELKLKVEEIENDKKTELANVSSRYESIIVSLQQRPTRPTSESDNNPSPGNPESPQGATGVQLYRPDAEFLARFARDTAELQAELNSCYKKYDEVKDASNKLSTDE